MAVKDASTFTRTDLEELYDNQKLILYRMLELSSNNQVDFTIHISSDGGLSFEAKERTQTHTYLKSINQSKKQITYIESSALVN